MVIYMKYYAVKYENEKKIFTNWDECLEYVKGKKRVLYKAFLSLEEANAYLEDKKEVNYDLPTAYIDGSYDTVTGCYSFGGVLIIDDKIFDFKKKYDPDDFSSARNVAGEIKGAGFIINYAYNKGIKELNIIYDYEGIEKWYTGQWKAKSDIAKKYLEFASEIKDKIKVNFIKVKSHSNNKYNDMADKLAKEALGL